MSSLHGTGVAFTSALRTGWITMAAWALGLAGLVVTMTRSIGGLYPSLEQRMVYAQTMGVSQMTWAFNGRGYGLDTVGGITAYEIGFMGQLVFPLAGCALALRFSRAEEAAGRFDLMTAGRVGRLAPTLAALLATVLTLAGFAVLGWAGMAALDINAERAAWYLLGCAATALLFGCLTLAFAQVWPETRSVWTASLSAVLACYLWRAFFDGRDSSLALVSPLAWLPAQRPFEELEWWPVGAWAMTSMALVVVTIVLALRRDVGAGLVAPRPGPDSARPWVGTAWGWAWMMTARPWLGWLLGAAIWGVMVGIMSKEMTGLVADNPALMQVLGTTDPMDLVTRLALVLVTVLAAAAGVSSMASLGREEHHGRLGAVLSTQASRSTVWLAWSLLGVLQAVAVLLLGSAAFGLGSATSVSEAKLVGTALGAGLVLAAPVAFLVSVAALLRAAMPGWAALGWLPVAWTAVVGLLGESLDLPRWARDLDAVHASGEVPVDEPHLMVVLGLGAAMVALLAVATAVFVRRDLRHG